MEGLTASELAEVRAYHAPRYAFAAVELVLAPLLLIAAVRFLTRPMHRLARSWGRRVDGAALQRVWKGEGAPATVLFGLLFFGCFAFLALPAEVWFGFVHEHHFGLSHESWSRFLLDAAKAKAMGVFSISALTFGLFGIARRTRHWWWLVACFASIGLLISQALDSQRARLVVDQTSLEAGPLRTRLTQVLDSAHVAFADIQIVHSSEKSARVQASFAGTGPTRMVLLTDTLLTAMTESEVVAAVAHEAGHADEPRWPGRVVSCLAVFLFLGAIEGLFRASERRGWFGISERADVRVLPLIVLLFDVSATAIAPVSAARSRQHELAADHFAVMLTDDPASLASLLTKVGKINKSDPDPPRWYVLAGVTHPSIAERVALLQKNATPAPTTPATTGTSEQQEPGVIR